ncbi:MAG TPA: DUF4330 domain-containing protein [Clostridiales bacterium]|jgi:hypothetical protein|nr:DUF4330 domain-containing protein [Clostridiales bacterium]
MKLIDEKGKLFGLVNVVDLIVVLAIVAVAGAIAVKVLGTRVTDAISEKVDCYAEVAIIGAAPRIYEEVMRQDLVGERLVSGNEYLSATIEDVWLEDYVEQAKTDDGRIVDAKDPTKKTIVVLIRTTVAKDTPSPKIGSQELRSGRTYIVKTQTFESSGTIRYVEFGAYDPPAGMSTVM